MAAAGAALEEAIDVQWYEQHGTEVDRAALTLCRLRRGWPAARRPELGDEAVRSSSSVRAPKRLLWIASRAISYMDENGFPEAVGPWFPDEAAGAPVDPSRLS